MHRFIAAIGQPRTTRVGRGDREVVDAARGVARCGLGAHHRRARAVARQLVNHRPARHVKRAAVWGSARRWALPTQPSPRCRQALRSSTRRCENALRRPHRRAHRSSRGRTRMAAKGRPSASIGLPPPAARAWVQAAAQARGPVLAQAMARVWPGCSRRHLRRKRPAQWRKTAWSSAAIAAGAGSCRVSPGAVGQGWF